MHNSVQTMNVINLRITHKTANIPTLETLSIKNKKEALKQIKQLDGDISECVLLQTCNRTEVYAVTKKTIQTIKNIKKYITKNNNINQNTLKCIKSTSNRSAIKHILKVTSGLESMVIGEDQILNQVWNAYLEAEEAKTTGPVLNCVFKRAVNVGKKVRAETKINKGAVSIGSAAVELAEKVLGKLDDKIILVMGTGEIGTLVAKALSRRCLKPIFISNRTYERALRLAEELSGKAVKFDKLNQVLKEADVVICSTSAPHYLLTKKVMLNFWDFRKNPSDLIVIDISNPRNVEKEIEKISKVKLYNVDDLKIITNKNKKQRQKSVNAAKKIIEKELDILENEVKTNKVRKLISELLSNSEEIRQQELVKALKMIKNLDEKEKKIVSDLTSILIKKTFIPIINNLRTAAKNNDNKIIEVANKLFKVDIN